MEVSHVLITFVLRVRSITVHEINSLPVVHVLETLPGALRGDRLSWDSDLMAPSKCGSPVMKPSRWAVTRAVTLLPPLPARPSWPLVPTAVTAKHFSSQLSVFACLFFVAPSQQCSFLVSFLLVSLNRSLQCPFFCIYDIYLRYSLNGHHSLKIWRLFEMQNDKPFHGIVLWFKLNVINLLLSDWILLFQ